MTNETLTPSNAEHDELGMPPFSITPLGNEGAALGELMIDSTVISTLGELQKPDQVQAMANTTDECVPVTHGDCTKFPTCAYC